MANLYEVLADAQNGEAIPSWPRIRPFAATNRGRSGRAAACDIDGPKAIDCHARRSRQLIRLDGRSARPLRDV